MTLHITLTLSITVHVTDNTSIYSNRTVIIAKILGAFNKTISSKSMRQFGYKINMVVVTLYII